MAGEPEDERPSASVVSPASAPATVPAKLSKGGVVLGKDGKPCRTCNTMADWAAQSKTLQKSAAPRPAPARDCPPDVEQLGRSTWTLLHSIAATYPERPSRAEQADLVGFMGLFSKLYPCWVCADDFQAYMRREPVQARSRGDFGQWLCDAHNDVNKKLGKPVFDCRLWEQRWRTGWKDGRCD
ncbi:FAD-linked sulfhydryl oxidase ALR [Gaeumannomyces tritici R3-111a-1]|uniref:Sulfhydryl oxidase n=1 Tax=Gaeumannomyces tritici (strain R3-111a-1) TaxID=644352 RepID=J3NVC5_GAET3|nr:FAD-linked sulfhydryl oxidase ALR [Gaeumannomyces tritici R3-111a-1]EJT75301.1 FAD-linked sulfhydryl oxidase ALR [Gaeumannomyces tritici R3-111a-1]